MIKHLSKLLITFFSVLLLYIIFAVIGIFPFPQFIKEMFENPQDSMSEPERIARIIQDTYPTDIMIYGEDISFGVSVPERYIDRITEETLARKDNCEYSFLVINDLSDTVTLSNAQMDLLKKEIRKDHFCLMYLGRKYASAWDSPDSPHADAEGNLSYSYFWLNNSVKKCIGTWREKDEEDRLSYPETLGDSILFEIELYLQDIH